METQRKSTKIAGSMRQLFYEHYVIARYKGVYFVGGQVRDLGVVQASRLVASFHGLVAVMRRVFFNLFRRRRAMRKFEKELMATNVDGPFTKDRTVKLNVSCDRIMTPDEVEEVWRQAGGN